MIGGMLMGPAGATIGDALDHTVGENYELIDLALEDAEGFATTMVMSGATPPDPATVDAAAFAVEQGNVGQDSGGDVVQQLALPQEVATPTAADYGVQPQVGANSIAGAPTAADYAAGAVEDGQLGQQGQQQGQGQGLPWGDIALAYSQIPAQNATGRTPVAPALGVGTPGVKGAPGIGPSFVQQMIQDLLAAQAQRGGRG